MPTLTVLHIGTATGQETNWIPTIPSNDGASVQNNDGDYVSSGNDGLGNPKAPFDWWLGATTARPAWIDDGALTGTTINSVSVHIIHGNFDATNDLDVWFAFSTGGGAVAPTYGYTTPGDLGGYSLLPHSAGGPYTEYSRTFTLNPLTGVAWVKADIFSVLHNFYFDKFRDGASFPNYSNYRINQIYLVVDYSLPPGPTSIAPSSGSHGTVVITGTGFVDGDEGSICAPGTSVVSGGGTTLTCQLPYGGALTVSGDPFIPGLYDVSVGSYPPLVDAFTSEVTVTAAVAPIARQTFFANNGTPLAGGKVYTYAAGTVNTPLATYSDDELTVPLSNPIVLNAAGRPVASATDATEVSVYFLTESYKIVVTDADGVQLYAADHIDATSPNPATNVLLGFPLTITGGLTGGLPYFTSTTGLAATVFGASNFTPSNPSGVTSTSAVMMGLGSVVTFTPKSTRLRISVSGLCGNTTSGDGIAISLRYGTGAAPAYNAAATGTTIGTASGLSSVWANNATGPFVTQAVVTSLTVGTAYWFDLAANAVTGGTASITNVDISICDVP